VPAQPPSQPGAQDSFAVALQEAWAATIERDEELACKLMRAQVAFDEAARGSDFRKHLMLLGRHIRHGAGGGVADYGLFAKAVGQYMNVRGLNA
jgi:hypothetical protein